MNQQEIFNTVATHLFTQGERCTDGDSCLYRGPKGMKCAVGVLMPDSFYDPAMDGQSATVGVLADRYTTTKSGHPSRSKFAKLLREELNLLEKLQFAHDDKTNWKSDSRLKAALGNVARGFGLDTAVLSNLTLNKESQS